MRVGGLLQILSITVVAVRSVLAGGDAPGGHPDSTYPDGLMPEGIVGLSGGLCKPALHTTGNSPVTYLKIPEDSHSHSHSHSL